MSVKNKVQLITYADSLGGNLEALNTVLTEKLPNVFQGGVHILPPYPSSGDRGFSPLTYYQIDPAFGDWPDIHRIAETHDIMVDVMVNHVSRNSEYFWSFAQRGRQSEYAELFITLDKIWPGGEPPQEDVDKIFLRKPDHPFFDVVIGETGETERVWATFGIGDKVEQIDVDVNAPLTRQLLVDFMTHLREQGIEQLRIDAIGYVIKKAGTSCFMVEPDIYDFLNWLDGEAQLLGLTLLPEVHAHYTIQFKLADAGYYVYDFVLPALIFHTLVTKDSSKLAHHLEVCPRTQFNMLDCHDGIPIQPDMDDILTIDESQVLVNVSLERGANINKILGKNKRRPDFDAHQINITYYSALGKDDDAYIAARALQLFAPGIPQVYYVGLLAGKNDQAAVEEQEAGRAVNRHNYTLAEIDEALEQSVVQRLLNLIDLRNTHPAFDGTLAVSAPDAQQIALTWTHGDAVCSLTVDLVGYTSAVTYSAKNGAVEVMTL